MILAAGDYKKKMDVNNNSKWIWLDCSGCGWCCIMNNMNKTRATGTGTDKPCVQCDIFDISEIKAIEFKNIESNSKTEFKFLNKTQNINLS